MASMQAAISKAMKTMRHRCDFRPDIRQPRQPQSIQIQGLNGVVLRMNRSIEWRGFDQVTDL